MTIPSNKIIPLLDTNGGLPGMNQDQFAAEVLALVGSPQMVFCRGTFVAPTGAPNTLENCNLTITSNQSGFSIASNSQLVLPSTGHYLIMVGSAGISVAGALGDVNTAVAVPSQSFLLVQFGAGTIASMANPLIYRVTAAGAVDAFACPPGFVFGVGNITNIATQYFRIDYTNRVLQTGNQTGSGTFVCLKLRS